MSKPVAEVIVETLVDAGVRHCYGIVGDTLNRIAREIDRRDIESARAVLAGRGGDVLKMIKEEFL